MPIYEYECETCTERFEVIQKFSDAPIDTCAKCGKGPVRRLLSSPAIQFKGSGWYITDYAKKTENPKAQNPNPKSQGSESKSEGSDSKSESTKSESPKADTAKPKTQSGDA